MKLIVFEHVRYISDGARVFAYSNPTTFTSISLSPIEKESDTNSSNLAFLIFVVDTSIAVVNFVADEHGRSGSLSIPRSDANPMASVPAMD